MLLSSKRGFWRRRQSVGGPILWRPKSEFGGQTEGEVFQRDQGVGRVLSVALL